MYIQKVDPLLFKSLQNINKVIWIGKMNISAKYIRWAVLLIEFYLMKQGKNCYG